MGLFETLWYVFVPSRNKVYTILQPGPFSKNAMSDPLGTFTHALREQSLKQDTLVDYKTFYDKNELLAHLAAVGAKPEYEKVNH